MGNTIKWGILGTGIIARIFAKGLVESTTGTLLAVGSRTQEAADAFGESWSVPRRYGSYEALLADSDVQAIYIATPHPFHAEWAIKAAEAKKHILCEKPIALNHAEAMAIVEAAHRHDVFLMEAFMYRCHPQTTKLVELIRSGVIGQVRLIQAMFTFHADPDPESRLLNNKLGGGGILDVGCYCTSMARLLAGAAMGQPFAEPIRVTGAAQIGVRSQVDEYAVATLTFPGNILAQLVSGVQLKGDNAVRIFGSEGSIFVPTPWVPPVGQSTSIFVHRHDEAQTKELVLANSMSLYTSEADTVAAFLAERQSPTMSWEDTLGNMLVLDQWRRAVKVVYPVEEPAGSLLTIAKRPLAVNPDSIMKYGHIPGVEKPVSRLVMGFDNQITWPHTAAMLDDFFERGGNCFDTAFVYEHGQCEKMLGHWVKNRGLREQVVILDKGAYTPYCTPEGLSKQLMISLERLQTDYVDIYMLHHDNPEVPVGEFIDVLNEHKQAGRIRAFGGSNWSLERVQAANEWAREHDVTGFAAISNNFSLARMVDPLRAGSVSSSDEKSRAWLRETGMALMPWSSQARGFFAGRAESGDYSDEELVRCWYSHDNFQRLKRVNAMAKTRGVLPINIALAYVLCQPFPTFPLIGPRQICETRSSFPALTVELTQEDLRWLNLDD